MLFQFLFDGHFLLTSHKAHDMSLFGPDDDFESLLQGNYAQQEAHSIFNDLEPDLDNEWANASTLLYADPLTRLKSPTASPNISIGQESEEHKNPPSRAESSNEGDSASSDSYQQDDLPDDSPDESLDEYKPSKFQRTSKSKSAVTSTAVASTANVKALPATKKRTRLNRLSKLKSNETLAEQIQRLKAERDQFQSDNSQFIPSAQLDKKAQAAWIKKEKNKYYSQLSRFQKAIEDLEVQLTIERLTKENAELKRESQAAKHGGTTQSANPLEQLGVNRVRFESLQSEKLRLEADVTSLTEENDGLTKEIAKLQATCTALMQEKEKLTKELTEQSEVIKTKTAESKQVVEALLRSNEQDSTALETKKVAYKSLEEELKSHLAQEKILCDKAKFFVAQSQQFEGLYNKLKLQLEKLESEYSQRVHHDTQTIQHLQAQNRTLQGQQQELRSEVTIYEGIVERNEIDRRAVDEQISRLNQRIRELSQELEYRDERDQRTRETQSAHPYYDERRPPIQHARQLHSQRPAEPYTSEPNYPYRGQRFGNFK